MNAILGMLFSSAELAWEFLHSLGQKQTLANDEVLMVSFNAIGETGEYD